VVRLPAPTQHEDVQVICLDRDELETVGSCARQTIWIVDAHRDDARRCVVHADEKLTEVLEAAIRACYEPT